MLEKGKTFVKGEEYSEENIGDTFGIRGREFKNNTNFRFTINTLFIMGIICLQYLMPCS
jgi:hypothetical protein